MIIGERCAATSANNATPCQPQYMTHYLESSTRPRGAAGRDQREPTVEQIAQYLSIPREENEVSMDASATR